MRWSVVLPLLIVGVSLLGCSEDGSSEESDKSGQDLLESEQNRAGDLERLMRQLRSCVLAGEDETAISLAKKLFPTQQTLEFACSPENDVEGFRHVSRWINSVRPRRNRDYLELYPFRPWQNEIKVSTLTGAELAAGGDDKPEIDGFHPNVWKLARSGLLREEREYYSVDFRKCGDKVGQRYEIFVWDDERLVWKMLGPIWRALSQQNGENHK